MKVLNTICNTIYVEDLDLHFPYIENHHDELAPDMLKRSRCLRSLIVNGTFEVIDYDSNERIERSLVFMREKMKGVQTTPVDAPTVKSEPISGDNIEVKMRGIFYEAGGYGKVNRNVALGLKKSGIKIQIAPKNSHNQLNEDELSPIRALEKTSLSRSYILIDSVIPSFADIASAKYKILYTTIESYSVPTQFIECCNMYEEIWVTSPFAKQILKKYIPQKRIQVMEAGVDHVLYCEDGPRFDFRPNVKKFVFISVFGWNYRKGYDVLLRSYFDEFDQNDDVTLLIVSRYQGRIGRGGIQNRIQSDIDKIMNEFSGKNLPHVTRYSQLIAEKDMPALYRGAHCFVLPTRGEGSALPPVEASLCGLPVIMTNCSGQQMYLEKDNAFTIEIDELVETQTGQFEIHYWDGQKFPRLKSKKVHDQMKESMRYVYNNYAIARKRNKRLQHKILSGLTWNHTIKKMVNRLNQIRENL